jgi:hypothetical protein
VHFEDYRIRVGPEHAGEGAGRLVVTIAGDAPFANGRAYESVTTPGRFLTLGRGGESAEARRSPRARRENGAGAVHVFAIARDYTLTDRAEAPD